MTITYSCTVVSNAMPASNGGLVRLSCDLLSVMCYFYVRQSRVFFFFQPEFSSTHNNRIVPIRKQVYKGIGVAYNCFLKAPFLSMTSKPCQNGT